MEAKEAKKIAVVHDEAGKAVGVVEAKAAEKKPVLKVVPKKTESQKPPKVAAKAPAPKKPAEKKPVPKKGDSKKEEVKKPEETAKQPDQAPKSITFNRTAFQKDLAVAVDFTASGKSTMPVLTHILLESDGQGHGRMAATDLDVAWTKVLKVKGPKVSRCVPGHLLLKEVKALPMSETDVNLEFRDNLVSVNGRCKIFTLNADDFPVLPKIEKWVDLQIDNFVAGLKEVSPAMGDNDTRVALNGTYLDMEKKRVVASDGHRIHFEDVSIRGEKASSLILPRRAVSLIIKHPASGAPELVRQKGKATMGGSPDKPSSFSIEVFGHTVQVNWKPDKHGCSVEFKGPVSETGYRSKWMYPDEVKRGVKELGSLREYILSVAEDMYLTLHKTVAITVSDGYMTYPAAGGQMIIRTISGEYPKYENAIPKKNPVKVRFNSSEFLQNMEGAIPLTVEAVTLKINSGLTIQGQSPDRGDYKWRIPCKTEGKDKDSHIDLKFSAKFLIDAVKSFSAHEVIMELSTSEAACIVNRKAIVMPMRLK